MHATHPVPASAESPPYNYPLQRVRDRALAHIKTLDGLRAIAVVLVLWIHTNEALQPALLVKLARICQPGYVGVDFFFVLSGFLITRILLHNRRAGLPLRGFYLRRALRIVPIYYLTCGIVAFLAPGPELPWCFAYLSNFWLSYHTGAAILGHTWSLAVEEQFYLFWPLLMRIPGSRFYRVPVSAAGFAIAAAFVYTLARSPHATDHFLYMGTPFRMLSLALGALLACWEGSLFGDLRLVVRVCCAAMVVCAIGGILVKTHPASRWDEFGRLVSFAALSFGAVTGCIAIDKGKSAIAGFLRTRALAAIGRISYGLYLYHLPIFVLLGVNAGLNLRSHAAPTLTHLAIAYILTFAAAGLSYRFIESPLLSLNRHSTAPKPSASYILGMRVDPTSYDNASRAIFDWAREKSSRYVCVANVYNVMTAHDCDEFRRATNGADLVTPDGMPLVWCLRAVGHSRAGRVYGPDLTAALIVRAASSGFSVGFYGSTPETIQLLQLAIQSRYPELKIAYAFSPPFRPLTPPEDEKVVREINRSGVDILFVGLGTPRQDYWMAAHKGRIQSVMVGVGAAFDFLAGTKAQAPRWMMSIGMEWFFRLISEPRRLAKRYLKQNPRFIALFALEMVAAKFGRAKSAKSTA